MSDGMAGDAGDANGRRTGVPGAQAAAAGSVIRLLGAKDFGGAVVAFGITVSAFSMGARLGDPGTWGLVEFGSAVGFGAFLAVLGFAERWIFALHTTKGPSPDMADE